MGQKIAGTCYVKADGEQLVLVGAVEAPLNNANRETIVKGYFKEEEVIPFVKAEVAVPKGTDMVRITGATNATVTVEFANGKVYTLSGAYLVGEANYSSDEGKASLEWNGIEGDWS
jgi:hypothetical protein